MGTHRTTTPFFKGNLAARKHLASAVTVQTLSLGALGLMALMVPLLIKASGGPNDPAPENPVTAQNGVAPRYAVIDLGANMYPAGMNNSNVVVGLNSSGPAMWSQGTCYTLNGETGAVVSSINDSGHMVGEQGSIGNPQALYWANRSSSPTIIGNGYIPSVPWPTGSNTGGLPSPTDLLTGMFNVSIAPNDTVAGTLAFFHASPIMVNFSGGTSTYLYADVYTPPGHLTTYIPAFTTSVAAGYWAGNYEGSFTGFSEWGAVINGTKYDSKTVWAINDSGVAVGQDISSFNVGGSSGNAIIVAGAGSGTILGAGTAVALNNYTVSGTNVLAQPQIIGLDGSGNPTLWDYTNPDGSVATHYVAKKLNQLLPSNSGWSLNSSSFQAQSLYGPKGVAINNAGTIATQGTYSGTNTAIPQGEHGLALVAVQFKLRDSSKINSGWDPDIDTDRIPWTIAAKAATHGNFNDNELTKIVFPTDQLASMFELAVASDSTDYIEINPTSPGQPVELTQKETNISIIGKNTGPIPNEIFNATIELRLKNDPNHIVVAKMMVKVVPDLSPLVLKFYAVTDSRFLLGSVDLNFGFPADGTQIRSSFGSTGGMYSEVKNNFAQNNLNFQFDGTIESRNVAFLKDPVGDPNPPVSPAQVTVVSSLDNSDHAWVASHFQRSDFSGGHVACIFVHQLDSALGVFNTEAHLFFLSYDAWYPLYTTQGVPDDEWGHYPKLDAPTDNLGGNFSVGRVYSHETGHYFLLSTRATDSGMHDPGPFPTGTKALMVEGPNPPGPWIRHEDWDRAATSAVQLLNGQTPTP